MEDIEKKVVDLDDGSEESVKVVDNINSRIDSVENEISNLATDMNQIKEDNEKIVGILEKISDKVVNLEAKPEDIEEKLDEGEAEEEDASEEQPEEKEAAPEKDDAEEKEVEETKKESNEMTDAEINALVARIKNEILDEKVEEPEVKETEEETSEERVDNSISKDWRVRYNDQVAAAWDFYRLHNAAAGAKLQKINEYNYQDKIAKNDVGTSPMTIESLGDFVMPAEVDREIHGYRSSYRSLLDNVNYAETSALQFMYATRVGDIDMKNVAFCDDGEDGNLKPVETYGLTRGVAQMEEMAAVTPICDNATKYLAADILQDVAAGYRNDYDRKLAQLVIIRIQQAINETGNAVAYDPASSIDALVDFVKATTLVSDAVTNGTFIFNAKTHAAILEHMLRSNDELGFQSFTTGQVKTIFGYNYIIVPNDLMPTLGGSDVKTFSALNNATGTLEQTTITSPVFYGDLNEYRGKVSGGLSYTVSSDAAYEINGTVYSAYQRNELVLRGSFYRGGYIAEANKFAGLEPES